MGVDINRMRDNYRENQRGGDFWAPKPGVSSLYVHGPCRPDDEHKAVKGLPYIPIVIHYGVGKDNGMAICLDKDRNEILTHPEVLKWFKAQKIKPPKGCRACSAIEDNEVSADMADDMQPTTRFLWGVTPVAFKQDKAGDWQKLRPAPAPALVGSTIYNGIMEQFFENGDITDMESAIFVNVAREGTKKFDTKYTTSVDTTTLRKPKKLPPKLARFIKKAIAKDGACDLFKILLNMLKTPDQIQALIAGAAVDTSAGSDDDELDDLDDDDLLDDDDDDELEDGDDESDDADDVDDDESEGDEEPDEPEDDDEPEGDDESDDDDDLDDLDLDDLDLDEDDDEPEPAPKAKSKNKGKAPASKKAKADKTKPAKAKDPEPEPDDDDDESDDDDDDDLGLDDLDAQIAALNAKAKAKKAAAKKAKAKKAKA